LIDVLLVGFRLQRICANLQFVATYTQRDASLLTLPPPCLICSAGHAKNKELPWAEAG